MRDESYEEPLRRLFEVTAPLVRDLKRRGLLRCFFFMRKPPGLRLRFALRDPSGGAAREIDRCLKGAVRAGTLTRWFPSVYEPETFKFGGPEAMEAVHAHFFADSMAWWRWEQLRRGGTTRIGAKLFSVAVLNDLFSQVLDGPEEIWDAWCRVAVLHGASVASARPGAPAILIEHLLDRVSPGERTLLRGCVSSNRALARRFRAIYSRGKLLFANRLVLPHVALYHWNRQGFTPEDRAPIFAAMMGAWSPMGQPPIERRKE